MAALPQINSQGTNAKNQDGILRTGTRRTGPTAPNGPIIGDLWYDSSALVLNVWNGTVWDPIGGSGLDSGWITPTLLNGWVDFGGIYGSPAFRKINNVVHMRGLIKDGTATPGTNFFTLPVGFRPASVRHLFATESNDALARIEVEFTIGAVVAGTGTSSAWISLAPITFPVG